MTTPTRPTRTCATCGQPGATYVVGWRLIPGQPPVNIYAHPGPCAKTAEAQLAAPRPSPSIAPGTAPSTAPYPAPSIQLTLTLQ